jgi:hypothetical protein
VGCILREEPEAEAVATVETVAAEDWVAAVVRWVLVGWEAMDSVEAPAVAGSVVPVEEDLAVAMAAAGWAEASVAADWEETVGSAEEKVEAAATADLVADAVVADSEEALVVEAMAEAMAASDSAGVQVEVDSAVDAVATG